MDQIIIEGLEVTTRIGVYHWEQCIQQSLRIDLLLDFDCSQCGDDLQKTLDYDLICEDIRTLLSGKSFLLIERVANEVADFLHQKYSISKIVVTVHKPHTSNKVRTIAVRVERLNLNQ